MTDLLSGAGVVVAIIVVWLAIQNQQIQNQQMLRENDRMIDEINEALDRIERKMHD